MPMSGASQRTKRTLTPMVGRAATAAPGPGERGQQPGSSRAYVSSIGTTSLAWLPGAAARTLLLRITREYYIAKPAIAADAARVLQEVADPE